MTIEAVVECHIREGFRIRVDDIRRRWAENASAMERGLDRFEVMRFSRGR